MLHRALQPPRLQRALSRPRLSVRACLCFSVMRARDHSPVIILWHLRLLRETLWRMMVSTYTGLRLWIHTDYLVLAPVLNSDEYTVHDLYSASPKTKARPARRTQHPAGDRANNSPMPHKKPKLWQPTSGQINNLPLPHEEPAPQQPASTRANNAPIPGVTSVDSMFEAMKPRVQRPSVVLTIDASGLARAVPQASTNPTKSVRERYPGLLDSDPSDGEFTPQQPASNRANNPPLPREESIPQIIPVGNRVECAMHLRRRYNEAISQDAMSLRRLAPNVVNTVPAVRYSHSFGVCHLVTQRNRLELAPTVLSYPLRQSWKVCSQPRPQGTQGLKRDHTASAMRSLVRYDVHDT